MMYKYLRMGADQQTIYADRHVVPYPAGDTNRAASVPGCKLPALAARPPQTQAGIKQESNHHNPAPLHDAGAGFSGSHVKKTGGG